MPSHELNLDGLVGPTHNYAGLSQGNLASQSSRGSVSNPRAAALEGLAKMKFLADLGIPQAVLPPHERPDLSVLRRLGFTGSDATVLDRAHREDPLLLAAAASASAMWAANAATVSPSADTTDGTTDAKLHFTPANLVSSLHRSLETATTARLLKTIFPSGEHFSHHDPLPSVSPIGDEGAANHTRLCAAYDQPAVELFVYGRRAFDHSAPAPKKFPARQTLEASTAIARLHQLRPGATLFAQQSPAAIDAGVFHNDVIAVGNQDLFLCHEAAFVDTPAVLAQLNQTFRATTGHDLRTLIATEHELPLAVAVSSYLFNSQLVTLPDGSTALIAPTDCRDHPQAMRFIDRALAEGFIHHAHFVDVRQSMRNGGGPACLRLRIVLTDAQLAAMHPAVLFTPALYDRLTTWVTRHYRDSLAPDDLRDPNLLTETRTALDELARLLSLGSIYPFQHP